MNGQYLNTVTETLFIDINTPIFFKKNYSDPLSLSSMINIHRQRCINLVVVVVVSCRSVVVHQNVVDRSRGTMTTVEAKLHTSLCG